MDDESGVIIEFDMAHKDQLSFTFMGEARKAIQELSERTGKSGADVLKTALALYQLLLDKEKSWDKN